MQRFFTKNVMNLLLLVMSAFVVNAQKLNSIVVNSPADIAGTYVAVRATFGSTDNTPITANAAFINSGGATPTQGCTAGVTQNTGLITLVDRGTCEFGLKALNAENTGAVVAIICNNQANAAQAPFAMTAGVNGGQVTIPTFMVSYADCQKIRAAVLAGTANITVANNCIDTITYGEKVVWGDKDNEGNFTGGLNDWSVDNPNTWEWNADGDLIRGAFGGTTMQTPTSCSGIATFESDFYDNGGDQTMTGTGAGGCLAPCRGALISPNIDLSGENIEGLSIQFWQALRQFRSEYYVMVSKDGGLTWPDTIQINQEFVVNSASFNNLTKKIPLVGYAGVQQVRFKFEYVGNYYYWGIDDVVLINELVTDVKVNENFFAVAPTLRVPASQVAPMAFLADVSNIGNGDGTDVNLEVVIINQDNEIVTLENPYGIIEAGQVIENVPFAEYFTPPAEPQFYNAGYVITSAEEAETEIGNNIQEFFFEVTEKTFGTLLPEDQVTPANYMVDIASIWAVDDQLTNYWSGGNIFYLPKGEGYTVETVRFGLANDPANINESGYVLVDLYEWNDIDGNGASTIDERTLVGTNNIYLDGSIPNFRFIELPLFTPDIEGQPSTDPVLLKDNQQYLLVANSQPLDASVERYQFLTYNGFELDAFNRSIYQAATNYVMDSLDFGRTSGSLFALGGVDDSFDDIRSRQFQIVGNAATLFSYANMYLEMDIKAINNTYNPDITTKVTTFPNPAVNELYIDITLETEAQKVKVDVTSMDGKIVSTKLFDGVRDSRLKLDVSNIAAGSYNVLIHTNNGVVTKKVIIAK